MDLDELFRLTMQAAERAGVERIAVDASDPATLAFWVWDTWPVTQAFEMALRDSLGEPLPGCIVVTRMRHPATEVAAE